MARNAEALPLTDADLDAQLDAGRDLFDQKRASGLNATGVKFERLRRRFVLELGNGYSFGVPVTALPDLQHATASELATVEVSPSGMALRVPALDADYSVMGLVLGVTASALGQLGGRAKSPAKAAAAKANGARGGRPRKS